MSPTSPSFPLPSFNVTDSSELFFSRASRGLAHSIHVRGPRTRYFLQLTQGCGNPECTNKFCVSCKGADRLSHSFRSFLPRRSSFFCFSLDRDNTHTHTQAECD